ncbi:hypothetical protein UFOVP140_35 [uncultured Caudovirales phage]|uniref:HTH marR-type domain-containing protein n=1 Tax=uncultured Caudovirales phage TaxID=2100421 RepID=A0A6J5LG65_9CAUD|nr:hypothetical protein UFOVP140_35 [uncultured Caudovirales phage]
MRVRVTETSVMAYRSLVKDGKLQPMQTRILQALELGKMTRKELSVATGMELSGVCGRVNSLIAAGLVCISGTKRDDKTNKLQELVGLAAKQFELFQ